MNASFLAFFCTGEVMSTNVRSLERFKWWREFRVIVQVVSLLFSLVLVVLWIGAFVIDIDAGHLPLITKVLMSATLVWVVFIGVVLPLSIGREAATWRTYLDDVAKGNVVPRWLGDLPCCFRVTDFASVMDALLAEGARVMFFHEDGDRITFYVPADDRYAPRLVVYVVPVRDLRTPVEQTIVSWLTFNRVRFGKPGETWRFGIIPHPRDVLFPDRHRNRPEADAAFAKT